LCSLLFLVSFSLPAQAQDADGDLLADAVDPYPADPFNGGWRLLPGANGTAPLPRHEGDACEVGNRLLLFGGRETNLMQEYDPGSNQWRTIGPTPLAFHHGQGAVVGGLVYLIGAFSGAYPDEEPVPDVYIFDPAAAAWRKGPSIPVDRRRGAAASGVYGGKIYIAGGNTKGHRAGWVSWFDEFDPATGAWRRLPDAPQPRDHHRAVVIGDRMYLVSGRRTSFGQSGGVRGNTIPEVDVYDFASGLWSQLPEPIPTPRAGSAVVAQGREVIVAGGEDEGGSLSEVEALDVASGAWRTLPNLKQQRNGPVAVAAGNQIFVSGGQNPENASQEVLLLPPRPVPPPEFVTPGRPMNTALTRVVSVNCGGPRVGPFAAEAWFSGGWVEETNSAIAAAELAPEVVFKTRRMGECAYEFGGLDPLQTYRLDLHFAEFSADAGGSGTFEVWANGEPILQDFDVFREAGGRCRGLTREFTMRTGADGKFKLELRAGRAQPFLCGWSLFRASPIPSAASAFSMARPYDVLAKVGDPAAFGVLVSGRQPGSFQWRRNGAMLKGATAPVLRLNSVSLANAGEFGVLADGKVASASARLVVIGRPVYSSVVVKGGSTTLRVPFAGSNVRFQWFRDGLPLADTILRSGSRAAQLLIRKFSAADVGTYTCEVQAFGDREVVGDCKVRLMQVPTVVSPPPRAGIIGSMRWQLSSSEVRTSFSVKGLPKGLKYDPGKRLIYGTPSGAGTYPIWITPSNPAGSGLVQKYFLSVELPDPAFRGEWVGLADRSAAVNGMLGGAVRMTVTSTGSVSGWFRNGGTDYRFSGRLTGVPGGDASFRTVIDRGPLLPLVLYFTFPRGGDVVTGRVTMGGNEARVLARRGTVPGPGTAKSGSTLQCLFRLADDKKIGNLAVPQGTGWMQIRRTVGPASVALAASGCLADGTPISFTVPECEGGDFPIFSVYPAHNGSFTGWGNLSEPSFQGQAFSGRFQWRKLRPSDSLDTSYRAGIDLLVAGSGATRSAVSDISDSAEIVFSYGGLTWGQEIDLNQSYLLTPAGKGLFPGGPLSPAWISMQVDSARGTFTGNVRIKEGLVIRNFGYDGIFGDGTGEGFFTLRQLPVLGNSPVLSGSVQIRPR